MVEIDASKGDVVVEVSEETDFSLLFQTQSGGLISDLPLEERNGEYIHGYGKMAMIVNTKNGFMKLRKAD